jgi:hypothetical protein
MVASGSRTMIAGSLSSCIGLRVKSRKDIPKLAFTSPREALAEKFHMSEHLARREVRTIQKHLETNAQWRRFSLDRAFDDGSAELTVSGFNSAPQAEFAKTAKTKPIQTRFARSAMP